jgi:hypothetical protein
MSGAQVLPLSQGLFTCLSAIDLREASKHKWSAAKKEGNTYAVTAVRLPDGRWGSLYLHQLVGERLGIEGPVDHRDNNGLNNVRGNLRPGPEHLNAANKRKRSGCSSYYKGVSWNNRLEKWHSYITVNYKRRHLGYFDDEVQAAKAYDAAALAQWGSYARVNFGEVRC